MGRNILDFPLDFCGLAMDKIQILEIWVALLAMVVLDSNVLVYSLVSDWFLAVVVAYWVCLVDLAMVVLPVGFLGFLVGNYIQRSYHLALAPG